MLVLSRKVGEQVFIGDEIVLTIVRLSETKVQVGIDAPKSTVVLRSELASLDQQETGRINRKESE